MRSHGNAMSSESREPQLQQLRIAMCAFGVAGERALSILLNTCAISAKSLFCVTYQMVGNRGLISLLRRRGVPFSFEPISASSITESLHLLCPDILLSIHYRHLVPNDVLKLARLGGINLHPSLLPKYRGAFSGPWVIINGEKETGITYHVMTSEFDAGPILLQKSIPIERSETGFSLFHKLVDLGAKMLIPALKLAVIEPPVALPQVGEPTYYPRRVPFDGRIDPNWDPDKIDRFIRAMTFPPKPYASLFLNGVVHEVRTYADYVRLTAQSNF